MINLIELKVFDPKDMPNGIKPYQLLDCNQINIKSEELKDLQIEKDSIWTANDRFIEILWRMIATALENDGVSLSAPQIGIFRQFFIMRFFDLIGEGTKPGEKTLTNSSYIVVMNPSWSLSSKNEARVSAYEKCSSFPHENVLIERPYSVTAQYTTLNMKNENFHIIEELNGWRARIFLHEWDHLRGKTLIDYKR